MRYSILVSAYFILALSTHSLFAQDTGKEIEDDTIEYNWERFSVSLGGFLTSMNSTVNLMGQEHGLGIQVNLEDALGLSTSSTYIRGEAGYNFGAKRRSYIRMGYFGLIRNATKVLETEISIGNSIYPIGTEVNSRFDMHIIRALYDYAFFKDERVMLSISGGMYVFPIKLAFSTGNSIKESADLIAPLPVVGFRSEFFITPKILIKQNVEFLYVEISDYKGIIRDLNVWLEYNPFRHLGIGLGLNSFQFDFSAYGETRSSRGFVGSINTGFTGLLFYGKYYF